MAAIHSDILTLTINETPVDLTAFIDLNKTTLLSDHHGRRCPRRRGIRRKDRLQRDGCCHVSGHGSARPQFKHHEFPRRRTGTVQLLKLRHGYLSGGQNGRAQPAPRYGSGARRRRNTHFPGSNFQSQGGRQLQRGRPEL